LAESPSSSPEIKKVTACSRFPGTWDVANYLVARDMEEFRGTFGAAPQSIT
jgi:hypothetical protein